MSSRSSGRPRSEAADRRETIRACLVCDPSRLQEGPPANGAHLRNVRSVAIFPAGRRIGNAARRERRVSEEKREESVEREKREKKTGRKTEGKKYTNDGVRALVGISPREKVIAVATLP